MSGNAIPVLDADGHVTESYEQLAKYLDEPYRRRPLPRLQNSSIAS